MKHRLNLPIYVREWQEPRCPEGQHYVPCYRNKNGTYVKGYCKKVPKRKISLFRL